MLYKKLYNQAVLGSDSPLWRSSDSAASRKNILVSVAFRRDFLSHVAMWPCCLFKIKTDSFFASLFFFIPSPSPLGKQPSGHYSCSPHPHKKQYSANPSIQREKGGGVELVGSASTRPALFSVLHYKDNVHNTILIYAQWTLVSKCELFHPLLRNLFTAVYFLDFSKEKKKQNKWQAFQTIHQQVSLPRSARKGPLPLLNVLFLSPWKRHQRGGHREPWHKFSFELLLAFSFWQRVAECFRPYEKWLHVATVFATEKGHQIERGAPSKAALLSPAISAASAIFFFSSLAVAFFLSRWRPRTQHHHQMHRFAVNIMFSPNIKSLI